jgi:hypothetical protein
MKIKDTELSSVRVLFSWGVKLTSGARVRALCWFLCASYLNKSVKYG